MVVRKRELARSRAVNVVVVKYRKRLDGRVTLLRSQAQAVSGVAASVRRSLQERQQLYTFGTLTSIIQVLDNEVLSSPDSSL